MLGRHPAILGGGAKGFIYGLGPAAWFRAGEWITVTGSGVSAWADQSGNGRNLLQGTNSARPVDLSHSGANYLYLPGVAGNYASTPDSAAFPTSDIDIRIRVALADWTPGTTNMLVSKALTAGQYCFDFYIAPTTGIPVFRTSNDGTTLRTATSSAAPTFTDGAAYWIRVTRAAASGDVKFYTAADSATEPTSWTQLGTTQSTTAEGIKDGTTACYIGEGATSINFASGKVYRASIYSTIGGSTPVVDFDPSRASDSATSLVASTGETWTINSTGSLPAQIVGRSSVLFNGSAHFLKCNAFTLNQPTCVVMAVKQVSWTNVDYFCDGNANSSLGVLQVTASPQFRQTAGVGTSSNSNLAVGAVGILVAQFNGASSLTRVNNTAPVTGDAGSTNAGGFTLGARGDGTASFSNIQAYEALILPIAPSTAQLDRIVRYMMGKYGVV